MAHVTVEKVKEIFAYGRLRGLKGVSLGADIPPPRRYIEWSDTPKFYKGYRDIPPQTIPPHIQWAGNPVFAYVGLVEGGVEYRYSEDGKSSYVICPITREDKPVALISGLFDFWYHHFGLPGSLVPKPPSPRQSALAQLEPLAFIRDYLITPEADAFDVMLDRSDIVFVVDWREHDEDIVRACEAVLKTGHLSAEILDSDNSLGFEIWIEYKNAKRKILYPGKGADRNTTLLTLNDVLQPDYEIRFCKASDGGDTLAFLPLASEQWRQLEEEFSEARLSHHFKKLRPGVKLF